MTASTVNLIDLAGQRPLQIEDLPREVDNVRYELIDGSLYVTPLADYEHQDLVLKIAMLLAAKNPQGSTVLPGVNVILGSQTIVEPDVAVVDPAHLVHDGLGVSPKGLLFVVEITSPSTRRRDLTIKRQLYSEWEVPYLVVDRSTSPHTYAGYGDLPTWAGVVLPDR
ncbi:MAG TPA: Uma2 family endonuclease [Kineosporiaceae bacterium]|nr:Uma2 family endonuclease [Kineosporiaceae bacterium]